MARKSKFTVEQMVQALRETKGMVSLAAQRLNCDDQTIYNYRDKYPAVAAEIRHQDEIVNDTAELKLIQAIHNGEAWAIKYRLSTKGRKRGYVTQVEHSGPDGGDISVRLSWGDSE